MCTKINAASSLIIKHIKTALNNLIFGDIWRKINKKWTFYNDMLSRLIIAVIIIVCSLLFIYFAFSRKIKLRLTQAKNYSN